MKLLRLFLTLGLLAILAGCATSTPRMAEVRAFAATAPQLGAYHELPERYRATYQREQPFLSPQADLVREPLESHAPGRHRFRRRRPRGPERGTAGQGRGQGERR